jgi:hypothetical protein
MMDSPIFVGFLIFAGIAAAGHFFSRWSWSRALAVAGGIALAIASLIGLVHP